jgi:hypothetical protein
MNLKRNREVKVTAWINSHLVANSDWEVYTQEEESDNTIYFFVKDPNTDAQFKFKIEKTDQFEEYGK